MNRKYVTLVERGLDRYVASMEATGVAPVGVRTVTLARLARVTRQQMSTALQEYRCAQARPGITRYVVAAQHYGTASRWLILARPGDDAQVLQEARKDQAAWYVADAAHRAVRDALLEVTPGLRKSSTDALIADVTRFTESNLLSLVHFVQGLLVRDHEHAS